MYIRIVVASPSFTFMWIPKLMDKKNVFNHYLGKEHSAGRNPRSIITVEHDPSSLRQKVTNRKQINTSIFKSISQTFIFAKVWSSMHHWSILWKDSWIWRSFHRSRSLQLAFLKAFWSASCVRVILGWRGLRVFNRARGDEFSRFCIIRLFVSVKVIY